MPQSNGHARPGELLDRQPPRNGEAERSVLGGLLKSPDLLDGLNLQPGDFYERGHAAIYRAMMDLRQDGRHVDPLTVLERLKETGCAAAMGGDAALMPLLLELDRYGRDTAADAFLPSHADIVREKSRKRRARESIFDLLRAVADDTVPASEVQRRAVEAFTADPASGQAVRFSGMTVAELMKAEIHVQYIVDRALVEGQPCVIAGPQKALKTSLLVDMGLSCRTGGFFLGKFPVARPRTFALMTAESGLATIKDTVRRIAHAANIDAETLENFIIEDRVPVFGDAVHMAALRRFIADRAVEVLAIDPAYMCLDGDNQANLASQGRQLRAVNEVCRDTGATLILCHHTKRETFKLYEPLELGHIQGSGFPEWARQWLLLSRREPYADDTGSHRLWVRIGGSAGHGGVWGLDVEEGTIADDFGRRWDVTLQDAADIRQCERDDRQAKAESRTEQRLEEDRRKIVAALLRVPSGETMSNLSALSKLNNHRAKIALESLVDDEQVERVSVIKSGRPFDGYRLTNEQTTL